MNGRKSFISPHDISSLAYAELLNDNIIEFWLSVIHSELTEKDRERTFIFDCLYTNMPEETKRVAGDKRINKVDIFEKDFLIFSINWNR